MPRPSWRIYEHHAPALLLDLLHGGGQLLAAVAAAGAEHVAGQALGVDAAEHVLAVADVALDQRHVVLAGQVVDVAVDPEVPVTGGQFGAQASRTTCLSWRRQ